MDSLAEKKCKIQSILTKWFHSKTVVQNEGESDE